MIVILLVACRMDSGGGGTAGPWDTGATTPVITVPEPTGYPWELPAGFLVPEVPADNPMSAEKVALGRWLFHDPRLAGAGDRSCATCHRPELAFTDGLAVAEGHVRATPSLLNVAWEGYLDRADPRPRTLEEHAAATLTGTRPFELATTADEVLALLQSDSPADYPQLAEAAFGAPPSTADEAVSQAARALASFQRTLVSGDSPYDRYLFRGEEDAITASAANGGVLFYGERLECSHCHGGFTFASASSHRDVDPTWDGLPHFNIGLYNLGGTGAYPPENTGLFAVTGVASDMGRFKRPSIRNVALTAPYMHDGSLLDLDGVVEHYANAGTVTAEGPLAGDGRANPHKSPLVVGFVLTVTERNDLLAFLDALTEAGIGARPEWSDPFPD